MAEKKRIRKKVPENFTHGAAGRVNFLFPKMFSMVIPIANGTVASV